jgi:hypothetical protein
VIGDAPVAYFPEEGWLDPVVYAHAMLSAAQHRHGTKIVCGAKVVDLLMTGDRVSGVRLCAKWNTPPATWLITGAIWGTSSTYSKANSIPNFATGERSSCCRG